MGASAKLEGKKTWGGNQQWGRDPNTREGKEGCDTKRRNKRAHKTKRLLVEEEGGKRRNEILISFAQEGKYNWVLGGNHR